uniref:NADH-ubiquinone oxidoreductase chain 3 n=1 Tax=Elateroidea sp. 2 KM-2017 TaxID=2219425 RepID=A0A346RG86_9COLE|nr:NADH dehydrogenase subunit 3 [Elateroidea sp. 2 KM-2017]
MMIMNSMTIILSMLTLMFLMMNMLLKKKTFIDREKNSPYECGFNPKNSARLPFSLQFFMITLLFLIFDIEMTLILPFILTFKTNNLLIMTKIMLIFISILLLGLLHEWNQGILKWMK